MSLVVLDHAGYLGGGFVGVDVFFVVSGFVITAMLLRERGVTGGLDLRRFYTRRFARLTPALSVLVLVTVLASGFILSPLGPQQTAAKTGVGAMLLGANKVIAESTGDYFDAPAETNPLLHTWSLSVEEQFYLLFPALLAAAWVIGRRTRARAFTPIGLVTGVLGVSFAFTLLVPRLVGNEGTWLTGFYSPLTRAWEFAAGALLALTLARISPRLGPRLHAAASLSGVLLLLLALRLIDSSTPYPGAWTLLPVAATTLLILGGTAANDPIGRVLSTGAMVAVGDRSYSIYLWHWPFICLAAIQWPDSPWAVPCAALLSLAPAWLSYRYVETPGRRLRNLPGQRLLAAAVLLVALPIVASLAVMGLARAVWVPQAERVVGQALTLPAGYAAGCHLGQDEGPVEPEPCVWNADGTGDPVYLIGDSNAAQFTEALIGATSAQDRPLSVWTGSSCPALDLTVSGPAQGLGPVCQERARKTLRWLDEQPAGVVFVTAFDGYWTDPGYAVVDAQGRTIRTSEGKIDRMVGALTSSVEQLRRSGHDVVIIQTIPVFTDGFEWDPSTCTRADAIRGCPRQMPLDEALDRSAAVRAAVASAGTTTGARVIDLADDVCPDGVCVTHNGAIPVYRDARHITVAMSASLDDRFAREL